MRKQNDERAAAWARHLRVLDRSHGVVIVDGGSVWRVPAEAVSSHIVLEAGWTEILGRTRIDDDDLARLRFALHSIGRARSIEQLAGRGEPALRRWRRVDLSSLVARASTHESLLAWALAHAADSSGRGPAPIGVIVAGPVNPQRVRTAARGAGLPPVPTIAFEPWWIAERVAHRLLDIDGAPLAAQWLRVAHRWVFPNADLLATAERFLARPASKTGGELRELCDTTADLLSAALTIDDEATRRLVNQVRRAKDRSAAEEALRQLLQRHTEARSADGFAALLDLVRCVHPVEIELDGTTPTDVVQAAAALLTGQPGTWRAAVAPPLLARCGDQVRVDAPWLRDLSPSDAAAVLDRWPVPATAVPWRPGPLRRYLELIDRVDQAGTRGRRPGERPVDQDWVRQPWIASLFSSGLDCGVIGLLAAAQVDDVSEQAAIGLATALGHGRPRLAASVRAWDRPRLESDAHDVEGLAAATGLDDDEIVAYLHYRRCAGDGEALPSAASDLLDPHHLDRQAHELERRIAHAEGPARLAMSNELDRLRDPAVMAGRTAAGAKRVRNQLRRALAHYRQESLRHLLSAEAAAELGGFDRSIPLELLGDVVWLAGDPNLDAAILRRFVLAIPEGTTTGWPENQQWVEAQRAAKRFDVDRWLAGFETTTSVAGSTITYRTEHDLVRALHMGSWFDTCLAVRSGFNRVAALTNVVEANRHIVYGYDADGHVAVRKLLAVASTGGLVGYRTYAHQHYEAHKEALDRVCATFAEGCGLGLGREGRPSSLTGAFWYDDGTEAWATPGDGGGTDSSGTDLATDVHDQWQRGRLEAMARDRLDDRRAALALETSANPWLIAGIFLDERSFDARNVLATSRRRDAQALDILAFTDGEAYLQHLSRFGRFPRYWSPPEVPLDPRMVAAVARATDELSSCQEAVLPPAAALGFMAHTTRDLPRADHLQLLLHLTGSRRRVRTASNRARRRLVGADDPDTYLQYFLDAADEVLLSNSELSQMLHSEESVCTAALILARRRHSSRAAAVVAAALATAATRWPHLPELAVVAAALGSSGPPITGIGASWSPLEPASIDVVRRALVHRPAEMLPLLAPMSETARLGSTELQPAGTEETVEWEAARGLPGALQAAAQGDWTSLTSVVVACTRLFREPMAQAVVLEAAATGGTAGAECARFVATVCQRPGVGYDSTVHVVLARFALIAPDHPDVALDVARAIVATRDLEQKGFAGLLASVTRDLDDHDAVPILATYSEITGWIAGMRLSRSTDPLRVILATEPGARVAVIDAIIGPFTTEAAISLIAAAVEASSDEDLGTMWATATAEDGEQRFVAPVHLALLRALLARGCFTFDDVMSESAAAKAWGDLDAPRIAWLRSQLP